MQKSRFLFTFSHVNSRVTTPITIVAENLEQAIQELSRKSFREMPHDDKKLFLDSYPDPMRTMQKLWASDLNLESQIPIADMTVSDNPTLVKSTLAIRGQRVSEIIKF